MSNDLPQIFANMIAQTKTPCDVRSLFGELRSFFAYYDENYTGTWEQRHQALKQRNHDRDLYGLIFKFIGKDLQASTGGWRDLLHFENVYDVHKLILSDWAERRLAFLLQGCSPDDPKADAAYAQLLDELKKHILPYCQDYLSKWELRDCIFTFQNTEPSEVEDGLRLFGDAQYPCRAWKLVPSTLLSLSPTQHPLLWERLLSAEGLEVVMPTDSRQSEHVEVTFLNILLASCYRRLVLHADQVFEDFWEPITVNLYSTGPQIWENLEDFEYSGPNLPPYLLSLDLPKLKRFALLKRRAGSGVAQGLNETLDLVLASRWVSRLETLELHDLKDAEVKALSFWADKQSYLLHSQGKTSPLKELIVARGQTDILIKAFDKEAFPLLYIGST